MNITDKDIVEKKALCPGCKKAIRKIIACPHCNGEGVRENLFNNEYRFDQCEFCYETGKVGICKRCGEIPQPELYSWHDQIVQDPSFWIVNLLALAIFIAVVIIGYCR